MAHDTLGVKNEPQYAGTGSPSDAADLTELGAYAALVGNRRVGTASQRTALTGAEVWEGLRFGDTTDGLEYRRTGSGWVAPWHTEFTAAASVPADTDWGPGPLTVDATVSHSGSLVVSPANDKITLPVDGVYAISLRVVMSAASSGLTYISLKNSAGTVEYVSFDVASGNSSGTLNMPNFRATASTDLRFYFRGHTAATWTSRIRVTKL